MATPHYKDAHLLSIPPELRNQIYQYVFEKGGRPDQLTPLRVCKQIRAEASALAYASTTFKIDSCIKIGQWKPGLPRPHIDVSCLPIELRPYIDTVAMTWRYRGGLACLQLFTEQGINPTKIVVNSIGYLRSEDIKAEVREFILQHDSKLREIEIDIHSDEFGCPTNLTRAGRQICGLKVFLAAAITKAENMHLREEKDDLIMVKQLADRTTRELKVTILESGKQYGRNTAQRGIMDLVLSGYYARG